jgi:SPASM domain peptide maturase of grasp-with-spasm system
MNENRYFHLFANCIPVKGVNRSIICDLQQNTFEFIPNELWFMLTKQAKKTLAEIKAYFDHAYDVTIDEYFDFLIKKDFGRWVNQPDKGFKALDLSFETPSTISNCIIDFDASSNHPLSKIVAELDGLICQAVQLRFYHALSLGKLKEHLNFFNDSKIRGVEVIVPFSDEFTDESLNVLAECYPRLVYLVLSGAKDNKEEIYNHDKLKVNHTTSVIDSSHCCGYISPRSFRVNIKAFTEAKNFNSCLHKKIAIDKEGNISNCPSFPAKYGNIQSTGLIEAIRMQGFKKTWNIRKDDIHTCKVCEFRYICSDCRAFTRNRDDAFSKPLKCGYDPYTTVWEEWSAHPLKEKTTNQ